ncbi:MAG: ATP phosphoribosyltransferase [Nitrospirae bacterium]|nr:ATP phosphoribosyltransferase [Nitrospirota bacterium]
MSSRPGLRVVLPKGKVQGEVLRLLQRAGFPPPPRLGEDGLLHWRDTSSGTTFLLARDRDIPTFVEYGVCEIGLVGKDVLLEQERDVYEPLDLGLGRCRLVWAAPRAAAIAGSPRAASDGRRGRVATKYPRVTRAFFEGRDVEVEVVELYGSIELAPFLGLADSVVDLVSTGRTLRQMGLKEIQTIAPISTWVVVNRAASKLRADRVSAFLDRLERAQRG